MQDNEYDIKNGGVVEWDVQQFLGDLQNRLGILFMSLEIYIPVQQVVVIGRVNLKSSKEMKMSLDILYSHSHGNEGYIFVFFQ